jgi:predicted transcriptional regulator
MYESRRDRFEVISDILTEAMYGANKTRIMQRANLNHGRFKKYFHELLRIGVLKKERRTDGHIIYRTTEKGANLVNTINHAQNIMKI